MASEVFERREDVVRADRDVVALIAADGRDAEARPTRYGSSPYVSSNRPQRGSRPRSMTGASTCCEPRARASNAAALMTRSTSAGSQLLAEGDRHGKRGRMQRDETVQRLVVKHHGNGEPRVLHHPVLHGVDELGLLPRRAQPRPVRRARDFARPRELAEAVAEDLRRVRRIEASGLVLNCDLRPPDRLHLRELFLERHAATPGWRRVL